MSSFPLTKNSIVYYKWTITYDKEKCVWSDLDASILSSQGSGEWESEENYRFCILSYHSSTVNDNTEPDLPEDLGYPSSPSSSYCSLLYPKWRIVKTSSYVGDPFELSLSSSAGDDIWNKVTPFEYEMTQSEPSYCSSTPANPSFSNTLLRHDSDSSYRQFTAKVRCDSVTGVLTYVSGPTYAGSAPERGNGRWTFGGKTSINSDGETVFEVSWDSSTQGIGTSPVNFLDSSLVSELTSMCRSVSDTILAASDIVILGDSSYVSQQDQLYTGYPVYRVVFHCPEETFAQVETIAVAESKPISGMNIWEYHDTFLLDGEEHCVFYYLSTDQVVNVSLSEISVPSTSEVPLEDCPCSSSTNIPETVGQIQVMSLVVSGAIGKSYKANGVYSLVKELDDDIWIFESEDAEITLKYNLENWQFDLSYRYERDKIFRIDHSFIPSDIHVGKINLVSVDNVIFTDDDGSGYCTVSIEGNVFEELAESSSSSSSSSSESSVTASYLSTSSSSSSGF